MNELFQQSDRANIRWILLTGASALALAACASSVGLARAEDNDRPTVWVELGGQMEFLQGTSGRFSAPFMTAISPTPGPYKAGLFDSGMKPSRFAFGLEGAVSFRPKNSDWVFSAKARYGRARSGRHIHNQTLIPAYHFAQSGYYLTPPVAVAPFADVKSTFRENHTVLDFTVGRDVGVGLFGHGGSSTVSAGVRSAQFSSDTSIDIQARPLVIAHFKPTYFLGQLPKYFTWDQYAMAAHAERSFHGIGPSISWDASAALVGNPEDGELTLDWGINAAALFGRQKAKTDHATQENRFYRTKPRVQNIYPVVYQTGINSPERSRSVTVPNLGGTVGLSMRYPNAKVSFGYRADFFFGAVDTGIDSRRTSDLGFHGPFATISIGLGG